MSSFEISLDLNIKSREVDNSLFQMKLLNFWLTGRVPDDKNGLLGLVLRPELELVLIGRYHHGQISAPFIGDQSVEITGLATVRVPDEYGLIALRYGPGLLGHFGQRVGFLVGVHSSLSSPKVLI